MAVTVGARQGADLQLHLVAANSFGAITETVDPRQLQLGVKVTF